MLAGIVMGVVACGSDGAPLTITSSASSTSETVVPADTEHAPSSGVITTTTVPLAAGVDGGVSYLDPPPLLRLRSLGTVQVPSPESGGFEVAIGDLGLAVATWRDGDHPDTAITLVGFDGQQRLVDVDDALSGVLAYGPGEVAYVFDQAGSPFQDFAVAAVALDGDRVGRVVASNKVPINTYMELPRASFGHGRDGIVDRLRDVNATVLGYVDTAGQPITWTEATPSLLTTVGDDRFATQPSTDEGGLTVQSSTGRSWKLRIDAAPDRASSYVGPSPPAPSSEALSVFWTHIGPDARPDTDFGGPTMWVIAALQPNGDVRWWSVPDGWQVVASDVWGTVLARTSNNQIELSLANFSPTE